MWNVIPRFLGSGTTGSPQVCPILNDTMLCYLIGEIEVRLIQLERVFVNEPDKTADVRRLREQLDGLVGRYPAGTPNLFDAAWNEAYKMERLIALIEPAENLIAELRRRTGEAKEEQISAATRLSASMDAILPSATDSSGNVLVPSGEVQLRSLLLETLEELHWWYQRKFYARMIQKGATYRIVWVGVLTFFLFLFPYCLLYTLANQTKTLPLENWSWLPLYTSLTTGLFGALFSRLLYLQTYWDILTLGAIKDARDYTSILLRGCVGMTGAVVVYFFLQSGVISGGLFPNFEEIGLSQMRFPTPDASKADLVPLRLIFPDKALALLVVWCFLAGFSERLVPSILQSSEASLGKSNVAGSSS